MKAAYLEILRDCNLKCNFCSINGRTGIQTLEFAKKNLKRMYKLGCKKAVLTGGEPLLHPDVEEIIKFAYDLGFEVAIQTNGTLLTEEKAKNLKEAGLDQAIISIHSHISKVEDDLMNGNNVLEKQIKGIHFLHKEGIMSPVSIVITKQNYRHLPDFFEFMITQCPFVNHFTLNFVDPVGRSTMNKKVVPKYSEIELFLMKALLKLKKAKKTFRVERIPLCYFTEFAENSTELRRIITNESNLINRDNEYESFVDSYFEKYYVSGEACGFCWLKKVCPGINRFYANLYGTDELYPIFVDPQKIIKNSGAD